MFGTHAVIGMYYFTMALMNHNAEHTMDVKGLMLAIINNQAEQIQMMQSWLQAHHPQEPVYCGPDGVVVKSSNTP